MQKQKEQKTRIFNLAHELNMESKALVELCKQHGIEVKNQLSTVDQDVRDSIIQLVKRGASATSASPARPGLVGAPPEPKKRIVNLNTRAKAATALREAEPQEQEVEVEQPAAQPEPVLQEQVEQPAVDHPPQPEVIPEEAPAAVQPTPKAPEVEEKAPEQPAAHAPAPQPPEQEAPRPVTPPVTPPATPTRPPTPALPRAPLRDLGSPSRGDATRRRDRVPPAPRVAQPGSVHIAQPPTPVLSKRKDKEPKKPENKGFTKIGEITTQMDAKDVRDRLDQHHKQVGKAAEKPGVTAEEEEEERKGQGKKGAGGGKGAGGVIGRDQRHRDRQRRKQTTTVQRGTPVALVDVDDEPRHRGATRLKRQKQKQAGTMPRLKSGGKVPIEIPITVRSLSEAMGLRSGVLLLKLMSHGAEQGININSILDPDLAEAVAIEEGVELEIKKPLDAEDQLLKELEEPDNPEDLVLRAPIVTIMGHVDHGKTSLLDKIRQSEVVKTEAGGITQVIRAWRVEHEGKPVTFIDTPGHEAFTKMRARGANITDVAVIVVAVDDGVMPQTEEAINHAKAAGVSIVVALNKVDLPNANLRKAEQQLYGLGLLPDNMGGDIPFVKTSAATGEGIDELLENLALIAELKELKANPNKAGRGVCLEAHKDETEGVFATLLVRDGTLRRGDIILCGASYGRIRAMYNDLGRSIQEAGPSVPVRITGLDDVPNADDTFMVVPDLSTAREIADNRKSQAQEAQLARRVPVSLERLGEAKIAELKVILKAEARGSIEAIRAELEKMQHEEVRTRLLHAAIGGITESDVQLALTSPEDTVLLGFNVVADDRAQALAEERGVQIRTYNIIYQLTDDIRAALEGKLKPHEEVIQLGRAVVRQTFKISRVGTIAGCYVTQGTIERAAKIRVIRNGVVVYPPADRTASLESLKRHKDDAREVREGFECGIKLAGYDDIKVGDVIEAYRIEQIQRTLSS